MPRSAVVLARLATHASANTPDAQLLKAFVASQSGRRGPGGTRGGFPLEGDAFAELVRRHGPMVLAVCRRVLGDAHDAEDAFQATFLVLARKASSVRSENVSAWLHGVALRTARGVRVMRDRRRKHSLKSQEPGTRNQNETPAPDSSLALHEQAAIIDEELAKLPDYYREAIILCELRGLSRQQAAAELGVPEGTLSSRLASGKRKLAARLAARGLAGAAALTAILAPTSVSAALAEATSLAVRGAASGVAGAAASTVLKGMLFEQLRASLLTAFVLVAGVCGLAMTGAPGTPDAPPAKAGTPDAPKPAEDPAVELVKQLGSDDFATRESAEKELRKLGAKAEPALKAGLKSDDPEIRLRCATILADIRKDALAALMSDFDPAAEKQPDHPVWRRFKAVAGDTRASRALFMSWVERSRLAAIQADNNWLARLDAAEASPEAAGRQYREVAMAHAKHVHDNTKVRFHVPVGPCDLSDEAAFLLFLGTYPGTRDLPAALTEGEKALFREGEDRLIYARGLRLGLRGEMLETGKFDPKAVKGLAGTRLAFAKLFAAWLEQRDPTSPIVPDCLWFAAKNGVQEALPLARTIAADKFQHGRLPSPRLYPAALAVIAAFGTPADLPLFERHFKNTAEVALAFENRTGYFTFGTAITTQVADASVGLALLLCDQDPFTYGFTRAINCFRREDGRPSLANYELISFGMLSVFEKARPGVHEKAKAFLDKQKPKPDSEDSPVWHKFKAAAGDTEEVWKLYLRVVGSPKRAEMLVAAVEDPAKAAGSYAKECEELAKLFNHVRAGEKPPPSARTVTSDDVAALLFLGVLPRNDQKPPPGEADAVISDVLSAALTGEHKTTFGKLLVTWTELKPDRHPTGMEIALTNKVPGMPGVARKLLTDGKPTSLDRGRALRYLGLHGTVEDVPLVMKFADDKSRCAVLIHGPRKSKETPPREMVAEVRDVAVLVALQLHKQKWADFGFTLDVGRENDPPLPAHWLYACGFWNDETRSAAHKKARAWLEKQK